MCRMFAHKERWHAGLSSYGGTSIDPAAPWLSLVCINTAYYVRILSYMHRRERSVHSTPVLPVRARAQNYVLFNKLNFEYNI